jgi:hypothetical protein
MPGAGNGDYIIAVSRDSVLSGLRDIQIPALSRCAVG